MMVAMILMPTRKKSLRELKESLEARLEMDGNPWMRIKMHIALGQCTYHAAKASTDEKKSILNNPSISDLCRPM
jgi:hypothetical protein